MRIMKVLALLALFVGAALGKATRGNAAFTYTYSEPGLNGFYQLFTNYAPDLLSFNFDNAISSVYQTGMWLYYENVQFNQASGKVYWVHGIEITVDFPLEYSKTCSSLKFVGSADYMNVDSWTVYEGPIFTGSEYYGEADAANLGSLTDQGSSIILTGTSPWTFYDQERVYVFTSTYSETGTNGEFQPFYDYAPELQSYNFDNMIRSVYQFGMWLYYENEQYNQEPGKVYWVHGIGFFIDFPPEYAYMCSSLKSVGNPDYMNVDTWTVYEGPIFTGSEYYGEADAANLGSLTDQGSSIILTGTSPWTFYECRTSASPTTPSAPCARAAGPRTWPGPSRSRPSTGPATAPGASWSLSWGFVEPQERLLRGSSSWTTCNIALLCDT